MGSRRKKAKKVPTGHGEGIVESKKPRIPYDFDTGEADNPVWQVADIELDGPFGWCGIAGDHFLNVVLPKIQNFESMTWGEILGRRNHQVRVADLSRQAQKRLEALRLDDVEQLVSLRLSSRERVWGIRARRVLRLLWWDPTHQVCPSTKKYT